MSWIWYLIIFFAVMIVINILKKLVKWFILINIIVGLFLAVGTYYVYQDALDFRDNFQTSEKLILYEKGNEIIAGMYGTLEDNPLLLDESTIKIYKDYENQTDNFYKVIVIRHESFADMDEIEFSDDVLDISYVNELIDSENPIEKYQERLGKGLKLSETDNVKFKSMVFHNMFSEAVRQEPLFLFTNLKEENVLILPETILFKAIKRMPGFMIEKVIKTSPQE